MKKLNWTRIVAGVADLFLLCCGACVALICSACGVTQSESFLDANDVLVIIVLCFLAVFVVVEIISVIKISDSTVHTVLLAISLLLFVLFSDDFAQMFAPDSATIAQAFDCAQFLFFVLAALSVSYFWDYTFKLGVTKKQATVVIIAAAVCVAAYVGLSFAGWQSIAWLAFVADLAAITVIEYVSMHTRQNENLNFYVTEAMLYNIVGLSAADELCNSGLINFSASGFAALYGIGMIVLFCSVYVTYAMRTDRAALKASEYKLKYETVKAEALRGQIKPHFIFNSLAAIQSLYHKSLADGDKATSLFSRHLRANVEASNTDLIPFEDELDNIQVYIDLENMRVEKKFNVIFDIDTTDFEIPVLSLQPYIENAMRYSKVNEKEDGYIRISSRKTEESILLEICDNGVGFDPSAVSETSCGIRNSRERFSMLMGVEPQITSQKDAGTVVRVLIPQKEDAK